MSEGLREDLNHLLNLARERDVASRRLLAARVGDLFLDKIQPLNARERALVDDILAQLLRDAEIDVRRGLAERLAAERSVPRTLMVFLAEDEIEVARPVLLLSQMLEDTDLIRIARARTLDHRLAIAGRPTVSEAVSRVLVASGELPVALTLLSNHGARVATTELSWLARRARRIPPLRTPIVLRPELTADLALDLCWLVSLDLRRLILERFPISAAQLDKALERTLQSMADAVVGRREAAAEERAMATRLAESATITPRLLIKVLRLGQVRLFQLLFAIFSGLEAEAVQSMIAEAGGGALAPACKALGIAKGDFASLFLLSRGARPGEQIVDPRELSRVLVLYERIEVNEAKRMLEGWRSDPTYLRNLAARHSTRGDA